MTDLPHPTPVLPHLTIETGPAPTAAVIWLHGLGASGNDFEGVIPHFNLPATLPVRFILPHAPAMPVTINGGYVMPAWYDIVALELDDERKIDERHIQVSSNAISALIEREIARGIPSRRIILMGFSQGGAVAYHCGLTFAQPLAGIMGLSTYFATWRNLNIHPANAQIPVHIFHGSKDTVVTETMGQQALKQLAAKGLHPRFTSYPMAHELCMDEIHDIARVMQQWLSECA